MWEIECRAARKVAGRIAGRVACTATCHVTPAVASTAVLSAIWDAICTIMPRVVPCVLFSVTHLTIQDRMTKCLSRNICFDIRVHLRFARRVPGAMGSGVQVKDGAWDTIPSPRRIWVMSRASGPLTPTLSSGRRGRAERGRAAANDQAPSPNDRTPVPVVFVLRCFVHLRF
jgi:hypothetical protein